MLQAKCLSCHTAASRKLCPLTFLTFNKELEVRTFLKLSVCGGEDGFKLLSEASSILYTTVPVTLCNECNAMNAFQEETTNVCTLLSPFKRLLCLALSVTADFLTRLCVCSHLEQL